MSSEHKLEQRVLRFIRDNDLVSGGTLLVAVSGGPDSVCLLYILNSLRYELGIQLHVVHLDHQLRGVESEADAQYVAELARHLDLPSTIETRDVMSYRTKYRLSLEEAAREVRYTFITGVAEAIGASGAAVGHTRNDHVETVLMHLIRGSGTRGLIGLQPANLWRLGEKRLKIIRPLLTVSREETEIFCREHRLAPRMDTSNNALSLLRNRIRLELLPVLLKYNPNITEALVNTSRIAASELDFLDLASKVAWENTAKLVKNTVVLDKEKFLYLHPAVQRYLIRKAIVSTRSGATDPLKDIEAVHIEDIMNVLHKQAGKIIHLPYGLVFSVEYDRYLLGTDPAALSPYPRIEEQTTLKIPGNTQAGSWLVTAKIIKRAQMKKGSPFTAYFDIEKTGNNLFMRPVLPGDRFQPLGMVKIKKIAEFLIDVRVPHAWRARIPVICSPEHILWLPGYRIDERVKVTEATDHVLKVVMKQTRTT